MPIVIRTEVIHTERNVTYLGHPAIDHEVCTVDEAAFITSQEHHGLSLLDGFTKPTSREVNLTTVALRLVIAEPVLQKRSTSRVSDMLHANQAIRTGENILERRGAQGIEPESLTGVHDGQLAGQRQDSAFASSVGQLGCGAPHQGDHTSRVDDATSGLLVAAHALNGVLASKPHTLDVDVMRHVPYLLGGINGVGIVGVHDSSVVEDHVGAAPAILRFHHRLHVRLLGDVTLDDLHSRDIRNDLLHLRNGLFQGWDGDIGHEDLGSFAREENACF